MTTILMISIKTLKDYYPYDDNIEDKYVIPNIIKGQDFIIRPLIGDTKTDEILSEISNGAVSDTNAEWLKKIEPVLAWWTLSEVLYTTAYKIKNAPVTETSPGVARFEELIKISTRLRRDSEQYSGILTDWICGKENIGTAPGLKTYKTGIYLG